MYCSWGAHPDDPTLDNNENNQNNQILNNENNENNDNLSPNGVELQNLSVRIVNDPRDAGCNIVTDENGACPTYEISFSLQNNSGQGLDRITNATFNFNDGKPNIDIDFTCDKVPWFTESGESTGVIDLKLEYGFDLDFEYVCGLVEDSPDSYERESTSFDLVLGPEGPLDGELMLTVDGLKEDASTWTASSSPTSF